jgi:hypothetical protein
MVEIMQVEIAKKKTVESKCEKTKMGKQASYPHNQAYIF